MNKVRLTLKAIALTLGVSLLASTSTSAEHLIKRLKPHQVNGEISPEYFRGTSITITLGRASSPPFITNNYEINGLQVRTFYFPLDGELDLETRRLSYTYPRYPQGYRLEDTEVAELYIDPDVDGLNGNEVMAEQIKKPVDNEPKPSIPGSPIYKTGYIHLYNFYAFINKFIRDAIF